MTPHPRGCQCPGCQQRRLQQYYGPGGVPGGRAALATVIGVLVIVILVIVLWRSANCTMVLGTQVCR